MVRTYSMKPKLQLGVSLVELMVALVIGLFLIVGAVTIYTQSRATFRTTEAVARLQETARYAFDVLEPEIRMANYWGFSNRADYIEERAPRDVAAAPATLSAYEATIDSCGNNWVVNLDEYLGGNDDAYGGAGGLACDAYNDAPMDGSDLLVVRRVEETPTDLMTVGHVYLQTSRVRGTLFVAEDLNCLDTTDPACLPSGYAPPQSRTHQLLVSAYYVAEDSTGREGFPSLRRKRFTAMGQGVTDVEIVPGVEDMQLRFGVDTNGDSNVDLYIDPPGAAAVGGRIVSATVWLRIRAEEPDFTFTDTNTYQYADMADAYAPAGAERNFRRIVTSKTIQLRNARQ